MILALWRKFWCDPEIRARFTAARCVSLLILFLVYLPLDDRGWTGVSTVFWTPISFFRVLPGPPRSPEFIGAIQVIWKASLLTSATGLFGRVSTITSATLGFFLLGLPQCFGKIHHLDGFSVLLLCIFAIAPSGKNSPDESLAPALRTSQALFLLLFFAAGISKLRNSGFAWITASNMRFIWLTDLFVQSPPTRWAAFLARSDWACQAFAVLAIGLELLALPAFFVRAIRAPVLMGLLLMQAGIAVFQGIYFTPHLAGYALFIPWERVVKRFR